MSSSVVIGPRTVTAAPRLSWRALATCLGPAVTAAAVAAASGGFSPTSFGWTGLALAWATFVAVVLLTPRWGRLDVAWLAAAAAVCVDTLASAVWAGSAADAVDAGLRALAYLGGVAAALAILRGRDVERWLVGLVTGAACVCLYSLAVRLLPAHFPGFESEDYRLSAPLGYWNALGIFASIALLVALGVAACGSGARGRVLAAAAAVALAPTTYFTFSRGAWAALAVGTLAALAVSPRRLRLLSALPLLGAVPALAVLLAARSPALTQRGATLAAAGHAGHRLALELALLVVAQAAVATVYVRVLSPLEVSLSRRRAFATAVVILILAALAGAFARYGSPLTVARHAYHSFSSASTSGTNLNSRLFQFSNDGRIGLWHAAWKDFLAHPLVGSGAGSFGAFWLAHRPTSAFVQDAHSLYLETLAELGVVGLALLVWLLGVPLLAGLRARRVPLVPPALGAYVAFLVHAAVDWDWEMPAVTLLALFVGAALIAAARRQRSTPRGLRPPARAALALGALVAAVAAFVGLIGNIAIAGSQAAIVAGQGPRAVSEAQTARTWAPWSAQALLDLGRGRILAGDRQAGIADIRRAAVDDPGDWAIWLDLAAVTRGSEHRLALARSGALNHHSAEILAAEGGG